MTVDSPRETKPRMKRSSYVETGSLGTKERNKETRSEIKVFATGLQNKKKKMMIGVNKGVNR